MESELSNRVGEQDGPVRIELDDIDVNWKLMEIKKEGEGRWSCTVGGRPEARKLTLLLAEELSRETDGVDVAEHIKPRLVDPEPMSDGRLLGQITAAEYDQDDDHKGDIVLVEFVAKDRSQYQQLQNAMDRIIAMREDSK